MLTNVASALSSFHLLPAPILPLSHTLTHSHSLIIFSYPKADTGGCNQQAAGYRELHDELHKLGYAIVGLSRDAPKAQLAWKNKKNFKYSFLTESGQLSAQLGAKSKRK